jgi:hypothetical protein
MRLRSKPASFPGNFSFCDPRRKSSKQGLYNLRVKRAFGDATDEDRDDRPELHGTEQVIATFLRPEESKHYDLAGTYAMLTDGLMRYVARRRKDD